MSRKGCISVRSQQREGAGEPLRRRLAGVSVKCACVGEWREVSTASPAGQERVGVHRGCLAPRGLNDRQSDFEVVELAEEWRERDMCDDRRGRKRAGRRGRREEGKSTGGERITWAKAGSCPTDGRERERGKEKGGAGLVGTRDTAKRLLFRSPVKPARSRRSGGALSEITIKKLFRGATTRPPWSP